MLIVGIDGGGTKTEAVLCREDGQVLRRVRGGPSSPTSQPVEQAAEVLRQVLSRLLEDFGGLTAPVDALFAGISGGSVGGNVAVMRNILRRILPQCRALANHSDSVNALRCAIPQGDALVAIAGTGSSVFACVNGEMHQCGGWGYLLGDEGSGYDLGQRALRAALRALDGRGGETSLADACADVLGMDVRAAIPRLYQGGRPAIAAMAPVLLEQAERGDAIALRELDASAESMAETIQAAGRWIEGTALRKVALAGSVWQSPIFRMRVHALLGEKYLLCETDLPPVYGSFILALKQARQLFSPQIETTFRQTLLPAIYI